MVRYREITMNIALRRILEIAKNNDNPQMHYYNASSALIEEAEKELDELERIAGLYPSKD